MDWLSNTLSGIFSTENKTSDNKSKSKSKNRKKSAKKSNSKISGISKKRRSAKKIEILNQNMNIDAIKSNPAMNNTRPFGILISHASLKGKRDNNEDTEIVFESKDHRLQVFSIHDGHGGTFVSNYLEKNLPKYFISDRLSLPLSAAYIRAAFSKLNNDLEQKYKSRSTQVGSTCITAFIYNNHLTIANVGDCRAIIGKEKTALQITEDHKPGKKDEKKRIEQMGGSVSIERGDDFRVGDLSVSRAFGDFCNQYVIAVPEIFTKEIKEGDKFLIIGCDGLYDCLTNTEIVKFVNRHVKIPTQENVRGVAGKLANYAIEKGSTDNISVIIIFFQHTFS
jgi:serine/threonine protein phosphatase PrpC